ncbi:MAG: hypothetical protein OXU36_05275 [Candidatus Poribacteria bacterium]|nr:hypothetical protein [Candidatus Poribacteria bacterium]
MINCIHFGLVYEAESPPGRHGFLTASGRHRVMGKRGFLTSPSIMTLFDGRTLENSITESICRMQTRLDLLFIGWKEGGIKHKGWYETSLYGA